MKIVLTSHGNMCTGLLNSYEMIAGKNERIVCVALDDDGITAYRRKLLAELDATPPETAILILCDIKGGTPCNESYAYMLEHPGKVRVLYGMNLPMLLEAGFADSAPAQLDEVVAQIIESGKNATGSYCSIEADDDDMF